MRPDRAHRGAGGGSGDAITRRPPPRRARDSSWRGEVRSTSGTRRLSLMASTLFHGGRIHVRSGVSADALLARDGRVAAVGRVADVTRDAGNAERVDLRGGLMTPGWFDAHVHFMWWGFQMAAIDLRETTTLAEAVAATGRPMREPADRATPRATDADCGAATARAQQEALKRGVTGVESLEAASSYAALRRAHDRGALKVRIVMGISHRSLARSLPTTWVPPQIRDTSQFDFESALNTGMRTGNGDEWLQLGHVKFFADGALGSQT